MSSGCALRCIGPPTWYGSFSGSPPWLVAAVILAVVAHNVGYIWIKKQRQFRERAEPTEE
jgi:hypothetical protein